MILSNWLSNNYVEIFGAVAGILYVIFEIRQNIWLWPVGIITSGVYIWVFFTSKFYADMSLQGYYLIISVLGWYWWMRKTEGETRSKATQFRDSGRGSQEAERGSSATAEEEEGEKKSLQVTRIKFRTGVVLSVVFVIIYGIMWIVLSHFTDSPVPVCDSFITSLSIVATWMLARKIYEHWFLWIIVNTVSAILFITRGLYPTVILYIVYCAMSFVGLKEWGRAFIKIK
jgi:nicotinamide mononucleotide transporter